MFSDRELVVGCLMVCLLIILTITISTFIHGAVKHSRTMELYKTGALNCEIIREQKDDIQKQLDSYRKRERWGK